VGIADRGVGDSVVVYDGKKAIELYALNNKIETGVDERVYANFYPQFRLPDSPVFLTVF
jgi:hypothetical protein